jgi:CHASE2 domain-containing sensor protein
LLITYIAVVAVIAGVYAIHGLAGLDRESVDLRYHARGGQAPDPGIVIVAVDDKTIGAINQALPIPRNYYAQALDRLKAANAKLIVVDVQFIGASASPADDNALVDAIGRDGPVVLAAPDFGAGPSSVPAGHPGAAGAVLASAGVDPDPDGILRRMMYRQVELPTLAVKAAQLLTAHDSSGDFVDNHAWIDYQGGPGSFATVSLIDVVNGAVPAASLNGKTILIGVTAPVQKDVFQTAASSTPMAGVEVHANALQTLLQGVPLRSAPAPVDLILILLAAAIPVSLAMRLSGTYVLLGSALGLAAVLLGAQFLFDQGIIASVVYPAAALLLGLAAAVAVDSLVERRQRRALERALHSFIRPAKADFFISYRHDQSSFAAGALRKELVRRFGEQSVFMDTSVLNAGEEWPKAIREAIRGCSVMLVLVGPYWLSPRSTGEARRVDDPDDWVRLEVSSALRQPETVVVPLLLDGAKMPPAAELPEEMSALCEREAFALSGATLTDDVDRLVRAIQRARMSSGPEQHLIISGRPE